MHAGPLDLGLWTFAVLAVCIFVIAAVMLIITAGKASKEHGEINERAIELTYHDS